MSDDLKNRGPQDRSRINLNEDWEVRYWTKALGCTADELRDAIAESKSNLVDDVQKVLKK